MTDYTENEPITHRLLQNRGVQIREYDSDL